MAIFEIFNAVLKRATEVGASDIHISAGGPFRLRIKGEVVPVQSTGILKPQDTATIAAEILIVSKKVDREQVQIDSLTDFDCSYALPEVSRFRANICSQRGRAISFSTGGRPRLSKSGTLNGIVRSTSACKRQCEISFLNRLMTL